MKQSSSYGRIQTRSSPHIVRVAARWQEEPNITQATSGWYPDPAAGGALRWWDGERWTDQVRTSIDGKEFVADAGRIALGETVLATDAIDEVAFSVRQEKYDFRRYSCQLSAGSERLQVSFAQPGVTPPLQWWVLIRFLDAHVLPRVASELASRVATGETVRVGSLDAHRQGITGRARVSRVTLPWASIREVTRVREYLFVRGLDSSRRARTLRAAMFKPNVVSLPFLVALMQRGNEEQAALDSYY